MLVLFSNKNTKIRDFKTSFASASQMNEIPSLKNAFILIENGLISDFGKMSNIPKGKHFEINWLSDNSSDGSGTFPVKGTSPVIGIEPDRSPGKKDGGFEWISPSKRETNE